MIEGIPNIADQYAKLIRLYSKIDLATRDEAIYALTTADSSEYKSIQEYTEFVKEHLKILSNMNFALPKWLEGTYFRLGLPEDLAPYLFQLIQTARANKEELDIENMTVALSEHEKRLSNTEDAKAKAARFGKQDKPPGNPNPRGGGRSNRNNDKNNTGTPPQCDHCKGKHTKNKCFYLHKDKRPEKWEPYKGKEDLMIENINKSKDSNTRSENNSNKPKSFAAKVVNTTIPNEARTQVVYIDTTSDVHTFWDISKFTEYTKTRLGENTLEGVDSLTIDIPRTGSVILPTIINGELTKVEITGAYHVPDMKYNLLSVGTLEEKGCYVTIRHGIFKVMDLDDDVVFCGTRCGKEYILDLQYQDMPKALRSSSAPPANHGS